MSGLVEVYPWSTRMHPNTDSLYRQRQHSYCLPLPLCIWCKKTQVGFCISIGIPKIYERVDEQR